ncbi:MAG: LysR substrate-binding domain-containing protein [Planctomycetota bacterium]|nr:LysR substrate-binding domain-containing protein [Planctomycetota bacterium]
MNPIHLKTFLTVGKHLNYTRAAEELLISQPTVSRQIKQLEDHLQTRLFELLGKSLHYTAAGQTLAQEAVKALGVLDRLTEAVRAHGSTDNGALRIGASTTPGLYLLPSILSAYHTLYPNVDFDYSVENSSLIEKQILRNDLDVGFVGVPLNNNSIAQCPIVSDEIVCVGAPEHPLVLEEDVTAAQLSKETWIVREKGSATRSLFEEWFGSQGGAWNKVITLTNPEPVKKLVAANLGISFSSRFAVAEEISKGTLRCIDVKGLALTRQLFLVQHVDKLVTPVMECFLDMVFQRFPRPSFEESGTTPGKNVKPSRARSDKQAKNPNVNQRTKC